MTLEKLESDILGEAEKEAQRMLKEAKEQKEAMLAEARKRARERKEALSAESKARLAQEETGQLTKAKMAAREEESRAKREVVEKAYETFWSGMRKRQNILKSLFDAGRDEIGKVSAVYVRKGDMDYAKKAFRGIAVKERAITGGIILEESSGEQLIDMSFETLDGIVRDRTLRKVNQLIFGGGK